MALATLSTPTTEDEEPGHFSRPQQDWARFASLLSGAVAVKVAPC